MRSDPLFHTGDQYADALLKPIVRSLDELAARTGQYAARLRMSDSDRESVEAAHRIVQQARRDLAVLLSGGYGHAGGGA